MRPEFRFEVLYVGLPAFGLVGLVRIISAIRRRGLSLARDGDNALDVIDIVGSLFKVLK